jgi:two-component system, LytTR family, response regulator
MSFIKTVLVEDEPLSLAMLRTLLVELAPDVEIVGSASSIQTATKIINLTQPELVFLDIHLSDGYSFAILEQVEHKNFEIIFTTAYQQHAIQAFELSALHYLLKPIDEDQLLVALQRFREKRESGQSLQRYQLLHDTLTKQTQKICLPTKDAFIFVELSKITHIEADSNYSIFYLTNKSKIIVSKSLAEYEKILQHDYFVRIHDKYIVSLQYVKAYHRGKGGKIELEDGEMLDLATRRKDIFMEKMNLFARQ